jgi:hypothetical protein
MGCIAASYSFAANELMTANAQSPRSSIHDENAKRGTRGWMLEKTRIDPSKGFKATLSSWSATSDEQTLCSNAAITRGKLTTDGRLSIRCMMMVPIHGIGETRHESVFRGPTESIARSSMPHFLRALGSSFCGSSRLCTGWNKRDSTSPTFPTRIHIATRVLR